ncbi:MAG: response regulator [Desulfobacterales bacterium]|jgi:YesN/AraC family two-component response regulator|nr:response regulator [Desulfobacterales bacterium]
MKKILVIDDEKPTLAMFRLLLTACGYEVMMAETGAAGIELFKVEKPPIVITDIKMPGMDGLTVLKEIKAEHPATAVIMITGHGDSELAQKALDLHAIAFIHKPIHKEALDAALEKAAAWIATL